MGKPKNKETHDNYLFMKLTYNKKLKKNVVQMRGVGVKMLNKLREPSDSDLDEALKHRCF